MQVSLLDSFRRQHPRVLFVGYGETDNWAHQGRYDLVLHAAHDFDGFVKELWNTLQTMPAYRDKPRSSSPAITAAAAGRCSGRSTVSKSRVRKRMDRGHGTGYAALGERTQIGPVTQSQIAATLAGLIGKDYSKQNRPRPPR